MKEPILVVMAAGIGSRYGGLKQTDPVGVNGELIIDFSVYDAVKVGFKKVVFIINHKIENDFRIIIGDRLKKHIEVVYAYQEIEDVPDKKSIPEDRKKPWGTAHAIYTARNVIDAPFAVINADDYYGRDAFKQMYDFLSSDNLDKDNFSMVGYKLGNTVTEHGYVSRGVCSVNSEGYLENVIERTNIEKKSDSIMYFENEEWNLLNNDTIVSMNMWGFTPEIFLELEMLLVNFFKEDVKANPLKSEFYLPFVVNHFINNKSGNVKVLSTNEKWYGVTYSEDKEKVVDAISNLINDGKYPKYLWEES